MSRDINQAFSDHLAPLKSLVTYGGSALSTTATKVHTGSSDKRNSLMIKLLNGSSTARISLKTVATGEAAPSMSASFADDAGMVVLAERETDWFLVPASHDIYLVGSATASYCLMIVER